MSTKYEKNVYLAMLATENRLVVTREEGGRGLGEMGEGGQLLVW